MNNYSIESHFTICHTASFSSQLSITLKKNKLFKEEKFKVQNRYYNEENNLFKVQKRCDFLSLHKWSCSFNIPKTENFKRSLPHILCLLLMPLFPIPPLNTLCYKIRNRFLGRVYHFSLLICYSYSYLSIGWINTRPRTDLVVYWSIFSWSFLHWTITLQITPSLLGTISLTMPYW